MRRSGLLLLSFCIAIISPASFCQAQSFGAPWWPDLGAALSQAVGPPSIHISWAAAGNIKANISGTGNAVRSREELFPPTDSTITTFYLNAKGEGQIRFDARGIWLGASVPIYLTRVLTARIRGEYFFPLHDTIWASASGYEWLTTVAVDYTSGVPVNTNTDYYEEPGQIVMDASADTRWFFIDAEMSYSTEIPGATDILAGIRYDRLVSDISGPPVQNPRGARFPQEPVSARAELNSVTPYVGVRTFLGGLTFTVKGFPAVVFTQTGYNGQRGYFGEFVVDYDTGPLTGNLSGSLFFRGDVIHASFSQRSDFNSLFMASVTDPSLRNEGSDGKMSTSIHWSQLAIGGSINLSF